MKSFKFGLFAEYVAMFLYVIQFYKILRHRMRNYGGEIDLIAVRGNKLVFIEVKARSSDLDDVLVSVSQQQRIRKAAEIFLIHNRKYQNYEIRFDLVVIRSYKFPVVIRKAW